MSKNNVIPFKRFSEKARLRKVGYILTLREKQQQMFEKYGKKWMRPFGKLIYPSSQWCKAFGFPLTITDFVYRTLTKCYTFLVVGWRIKLGEYMYLGGMKSVASASDKEGFVKLTVYVKGKVVEEVEVKV